MMRIQEIDFTFPVGLVICLLVAVVGISYGRQYRMKDIFKDHFLIGTALNDDQIDGKDVKSLTLMETHFDSITAENVMKWDYIHPKPDTYHFEPADRFADLGKKSNLFLVGHTLIWHAQTPDWVFQDASGKPVTRDILLKRMRDHILTVVGRYKGRIQGWDVINEVVTDDGEMRKSQWLKMIGEDYVQKAFEYTHEADPEARLYYNDYSLYLPAKREGVVRLIRNLQSKGIHVDGIGLQGHWGLDYPEKLKEIENSILAFSKLGVEVMITELDVNVLPLPDKHVGADVSIHFELEKGFNPYPDGLPDSVQKKLADRYAELLCLFLKHKDKISRVTVWGIHDGQSWLNYWPIKGRTNYPLLFDRNYQPKPAFHAVVKTIQSQK